jgi:hypothetical protein
MPYNGNGVYTPPSNSWNPAVANTEIDENDWASMLADFTAAFTGVITADGQTTTTAAIPFGTLGILTDKVNESTSTAGVAVKGTTANPATDAAAGYVGQYITSTIAIGSGVALVAATDKTITSISLTAGDWDVSGVFGADSNSSIASNICGPSLTTNTRGAANAIAFASGISGNATLQTVFPTVRFSLASTTTVYLVGAVSFSGTCVGYGRISARRVR